jgi:hypothetical protein
MDLYFAGGAITALLMLGFVFVAWIDDQGLPKWRRSSGLSWLVVVFLFPAISFIAWPLVVAILAASLIRKHS